jgi:alcohol dehydrogenase (cytochrome c)
MIVAQQTRAQQRPTGPYTFEQALAGREAYLANCAACHATDLSGLEGPQLAGGTFMNQWGDRTARELIGFIRASMPPGAGGSLPDQSYINLAAFILDANGARPGDRGLSSESDVLIRTVASGQPAVYVQPGAARPALTAPAAASQPRGGNPPRQAPRGLTVVGEVKNFVSVTDLMLRNPDPDDWLMIRHDYRATSYSPLNQITAQNVSDLRLVWSWAMQDGASNGNQPAPVVHNGVLYVNNAGQVLEALNARTGDLIWENRYGSNLGAPPCVGSRSMMTRFS